MADIRFGALRLAALAAVVAVCCATLLLTLRDSAAAPAPGAPTATDTPAPPFGFAAERVQPAFQQASTSQSSIPVTITVENVNNLGAYEVLLTYDSAIVQFLNATNQGFLGSTGRSVFCAAPVINDVGGTLKRLRFGCGTLGAAPPGPNGNGDLAIIEFAPAGIGLTQLVLEPSLADPFGTPILAVAFNGAIDVAPGPTATPTFTNTPTPTATPCPGGICPTATPVLCTPTSMVIQPSTLDGSPNTVLQVPVLAVNACNVGAFEFELAFDSELLEFSSATTGAFLASTGRPVQCLPPQVGAALARITCVTLGPPPPAGASGTGTLATVQFVARALGSGTISLINTALLTPDAVGIEHTSSEASVSITACPTCITVTPTFTPSPTPTFTSSPTLPPTHTPTPCGGPCPTSTHTPTAVIATATNTPATTPIDLRVEPTSYAQTEGNSITVTVKAFNAVNLGAFSFTVLFDASVLSYESIAIGPFLGSTGRSVFCEPATAAGSVRLSCSSLGSEPPGPTGNGVLGTISFNGATAGSSALTLSQVLFTRPSAQIIPTGSLQHGAATISACSGSCPTATPTDVGSPTPTATPGGVAVVGVNPPSFTVSPGSTFTVDVTVDHVHNLGAFEFVFEYSQGGFVDVVDVQPGTFLGATGRPVVCPTPTVSSFTVRYSCGTLGSSALGPSGSGVLATLTLHANDIGIANPFGLTSALLSDPLANNIPLQLAPAGTLTSLPPTPTPTPGGSGFSSSGGGTSFATTQMSDGAPGDAAQPDLTALSIGASMLMLGGAYVLFIRRRTAPMRQAFAVVIVMAIAVPVFASASVRAGSGPALEPEPAVDNLFIGGAPVVIGQEVSGVAGSANVAGFDLVLRYDANLLDVTMADGGFLGSSGRNANCSTSIITFYERKLSCTTTGGPSYPSGDGTLATLTIEPGADLDLWLRSTAPNGGALALDVVSATTRLIDATGATVALTDISDGAVMLRALEGDVNSDCIVDVTDHQELAARYPSQQGDAAYAQLYDLEPSPADGDIDFHDLQFVLGRDRSTCGVPIPEQPPDPTPTPVDVDQDDDGLYDGIDNCPNVENAAQQDGDADDLGDACETVFGTNAANADSDGDGCEDGREARVLTFSKQQGGDRSPSSAWDFFDVPVPALSAGNAGGARDGAVSLADVASVLLYFGATLENPDQPNGNGVSYGSDWDADLVLDGAEYDRTPSVVVGKPWRSGAPSGAVSLEDAALALTQFGHDCSSPP
jgi:hypothetical protein